MLLCKHTRIFLLADSDSCRAWLQYFHCCREEDRIINNNGRNTKTLLISFERKAKPPQHPLAQSDSIPVTKFYLLLIYNWPGRMTNSAIRSAEAVKHVFFARSANYRGPKAPQPAQRACLPQGLALGSRSEPFTLVKYIVCRGSAGNPEQCPVAPPIHCLGLPETMQGQHDLFAPTV